MIFLFTVDDDALPYPDQDALMDLAKVWVTIIANKMKDLNTTTNQSPGIQLHRDIGLCCMVLSAKASIIQVNGLGIDQHKTVLAEIVLYLTSCKRIVDSEGSGVILKMHQGTLLKSLGLREEAMGFYRREVPSVGSPACRAQTSMKAEFLFDAAKTISCDAFLDPHFACDVSNFK